jgi:hypothetical protein
VAAIAAAGMAGRVWAAPPKPFVRASIQSIKAAEQFLAQIGMPMQLGPMIEHSLGVEAGAVATDRPVGMVVLANKELLKVEDQGKGAAVVVVPMVAGKGTIEQLRSTGFNEVIGNEDFAQKGDMFVKRSEDSMLVAGADRPLNLVEEAPFKADYAAAPAPAPVAAATFNLAAIRTAVPDVYNAILTRLAPNQSSARPEDAAIQAQHRDMLEHLERISLQVATQANDVHVKTWWIPSTMDAPAAHPRPAFPPGLAAEIHMSLPPGTLRQMMPLTGGDESTRREATGKLVDVVASASTISLGLGMSAENVPTLYVVEQFDQDIDLGAAVKSAWATAGKQTAGEKPLATYQSGGKTVLRAEIPPGKSGGKPVFVDFEQNGRVALITVSPSEAHAIDALAAAGMKGQLVQGLLTTGSADPGKLVEVIEGLTGQPVAFPLGMLSRTMEGQAIGWTSQVSAGYVYTDVQVPIATVKNLVAMAGPMMGGRAGPAPAPARGNGPRGGARGGRGGSANP